MNKCKKILNISGISLIAAISAINYNILIFPNSFAPSGIDGICTMIQDIFGISMGYFSLLANLPLVIMAWLFLNRDFAVKTIIYVVVFSTVIILLKKTDISFLHYHTKTGTSTVLAPVASGAIRGILYSLTIKLKGSSGGVDVVSALVKRKKPHYNFMTTIFVINIIVAISSYFVYGYKLEPVICSIIYAYITSTTSNHILSERSETVKFEIVTPNVEEMLAQISDNLHQPATVLEAQGAYTGTQKKLVLCVVNKETAPLVEKIIHESPNAVYFKSTVNNGNL